MRAVVSMRQKAGLLINNWWQVGSTTTYPHRNEKANGISLQGSASLCPCTAMAGQAHPKEDTMSAAPLTAKGRASGAVDRPRPPSGRGVDANSGVT